MTDDELLDGVAGDDVENPPVDVETSTEVNPTVASYERYLLENHKKIIDSALEADPEEKNTTINQLLRSLTTIDRSHDVIKLPQSLLDKISHEDRDISDDIKDIAYSCLRGEMSPPEAEKALEILSIFFQVVELPELMKQIAGAGGGSKFLPSMTGYEDED